MRPAFRDRKEKLPTNNDEESSFVDKKIEISNLNLIRDMMELFELEEGLL